MAEVVVIQDEPTTPEPMPESAPEPKAQATPELSLTVGELRAEMEQMKSDREKLQQETETLHSLCDSLATQLTGMQQQNHQMERAVAEAIETAAPTAEVEPIPVPTIVEADEPKTVTTARGILHRIFLS